MPTKKSFLIGSSILRNETQLESLLYLHFGRFETALFLVSTSWKTKNALIRCFRELLPFSKSYHHASFLRTKFPIILCRVSSEYNICYFGSTKRYLEKRFKERVHRSAVTGKKWSAVQVYPLTQHIRSDPCYRASMSRDEFPIIWREKSPYLFLKEVLNSLCW